MLNLLSLRMRAPYMKKRIGTGNRATVRKPRRDMA
jgi:hypothetical protein